MDEVNAEPVDLGAVLWEGVEASLEPVPVVLVAPISDQRLSLLEGYSSTPELHYLWVCLKTRIACCFIGESFKESFPSSARLGQGMASWYPFFSATTRRSCTVPNGVVSVPLQSFQGPPCSWSSRVENSPKMAFILLKAGKDTASVNGIVLKGPKLLG